MSSEWICVGISANDKNGGFAASLDPTDRLQGRVYEITRGLWRGEIIELPYRNLLHKCTGYSALETQQKCEEIVSHLVS